MYDSNNQKITTSHLARNAYLYIRQSTIRQVFENTESTKRQYALRDKAVALGWSIEQIIVIDSDLGKSGAESDRQGFQQLVTEVGLGHAGIVLGLEVSRLARNSMDWHRLLEICALTRTLILDEDGIYDPGHFNDRLLLGLKGTMSEAELHIIRARLQGGIENKARRGELQMRLPAGFIYDNKQVKLDPDQQVQNAIYLLFSTFKRTNSACATVRYFNKQAIKFPCRPHTGPNKGELLWGDLTHSKVLQILHNPRYSGAFVYGKTKTHKTINGAYNVKKIKLEDWRVLIQDAHIGYISWQEYEANLKQLCENAYAYGYDRRKNPPREGPALLQGIVICGYCGLRMTVRYKSVNGKQIPCYICQREGIEHATTICQDIHGTAIDEAIGKLLLATIAPMNLEVAFAVEQELQLRLEKTDLLRKQQVERAKYEADLARRRFMRVNPDNRLVADTLEAEWNEKLRLYHAAQEEYEQQHQADCNKLDDQQKEKIKELVQNFPKVWNNPKISHKERKHLVRYIIEDVTLKKAEKLTMYIRFKGGATKTLMLPLPKKNWQLWQTDQKVIDTINQLLQQYTDNQTAEILNERGLYSGRHQVFTSNIVARLRRTYDLKNKYGMLRGQGLLTVKEVAKLLNIETVTVNLWRRKGLLKGFPYNDKGECLYEHPIINFPIRAKCKTRKNNPINKIITDGSMEVQYAT